MVSKIGQAALGRANTCKYKLPEDDEYRCPHAPMSKAQRLCVFHVPKRAETEASNTMSPAAQKLNTEFGESLSEWISFHIESDAEFIDCRGFEFPEFQFSPMVLPIQADFEHAVFNGDIEFNVEVPLPNPPNQYDTHERSLLRHGASFGNAHFKGDAAFGGCAVDSELSFRSAVFDGKAVFASAEIKTCDFSSAVFSADADFSHANIHYAMFHDVQFQGIADFSTFVAHEAAVFNEAEFHKPTEFWRCHFGVGIEERKGEHEESNVTLNLGDGGLAGKVGEAAVIAGNEASETPARIATSFARSIFHDTVTFSETFFNSGAVFNGATFRKRALFLGLDCNLFSEGAAFTDVMLPKDEEVIFERVDLGKTQFHDTPLDKVVFRDVAWGKSTGWIRRLFMGNSYILWDEVRPVDGMYDYFDGVKTADNYRQLVINYERKRDYETAEAFHVSEMEMRRKAAGGGLRKYINGYSLYLISSRYGTSYPQAVSILALLLFTFSTLFLYAGLSPTSENKLPDARVIEYDLFPDDTNSAPEILQLLSDWRESFFYTLEIATFQKEKFYQPISWQGRALVYPAIILLAGQAALLLLSIRRRFRRE